MEAQDSIVLPLLDVGHVLEDCAVALVDLRIVAAFLEHLDVHASLFMAKASLSIMKKPTLQCTFDSTSKVIMF